MKTKDCTYRCEKCGREWHILVNTDPLVKELRGVGGERMRLKLSEFMGSVVMLAVAIGAAAIVVLSLASCGAEPEQTWPESAEFSQIESGGDRFSMHDTNLTGCKVVVDHETGVEYLVWHGLFEGSVCPLLDADGSPLRVAEAGD